MCLAYSHKFAPASLLAPLRYISVPIGILVGVMFFDERLYASFFLGTFLIIISSIVIVLFEKKNETHI